jgi:hypothetical protein
MRQILHIFRKDVRHFWIEILASVVVLSGYIWRVLHQWANPTTTSDLPNFLQGLLMALTPISWCLLVVRTIQDESLMGDRQFWVTRPYEWKKLIAAKALFIFLFVNVPLFTANAIFLKNSGFTATRYLAGLLWIQLSIILVLILPAACVSVVTSTFVQVILWTLGIGGYIAIVASLSSLIPDSHIPTSTLDSSDLIAPGALAVVFLGIVLWQYTQRRPWIPRAIIVAMALVIAVGSVVPTTETQVTRAYPLLAAGEQLPFHLTPVPPKRSTEDQSQLGEKKVELSIPVQFAGVPAGSLVVVAGTHATIRTRNGDQVTTKWVNDYWEVWPNEETESVRVEIDRSFFETARFVPSDIRVTFAFTEYHEVNSRQIVTAPGEFPVDGVGICWVSSPRVSFWFQGSIGCRSPLKSPKILARLDTAMSTCPRVPNMTEVPRTTRYASYLNDNSVEPAIIPIQTLSLSFSEPIRVNDKTVVPGVCPGTPVTISTPDLIRRASTEVEIDGADLRDYLPPPTIRVRFPFAPTE